MLQQHRRQRNRKDKVINRGRDRKREREGKRGREILLRLYPEILDQLLQIEYKNIKHILCFATKHKNINSSLAKQVWRYKRIGHRCVNRPRKT